MAEVTQQTVAQAATQAAARIRCVMLPRPAHKNGNQRASSFGITPMMAVAVSVTGMRDEMQLVSVLKKTAIESLIPMRLRVIFLPVAVYVTKRSIGDNTQNHGMSDLYTMSVLRNAIPIMLR